MIPFRFNPESLSRTRRRRGGPERRRRRGRRRRCGRGARGRGERRPVERLAQGELLGADPARPRRPRGGRVEPTASTTEFGIAAGDRRDRGPAAIRPRPSPRRAPTAPSRSARRGRARRCCFVWGRKRVLPVRIASLKIDESVYNNHLNPVRAEIEASLEVLGEADAPNDPASGPRSTTRARSGASWRGCSTTTRPRRARTSCRCGTP